VALSGRTRWISGSRQCGWEWVLPRWKVDSFLLRPGVHPGTFTLAEAWPVRIAASACDPVRGTAGWRWIMQKRPYCYSIALKSGSTGSRLRFFRWGKSAQGKARHRIFGHVIWAVCPESLGRNHQASGPAPTFRDHRHSMHFGCSFSGSFGLSNLPNIILTGL
jgi:hypothetical protein